jgi:omega-6 fatty acid desaturase (delta-12 desaturase)
MIDSIPDMDAAQRKAIGAQFQRPSTARATWQLINTIVPYVLVWYGMYRALEISIWLTVPLAVLAAALLVRVFIIFHDCGHGSYFSSRRVNDAVGFITGLLTFSPYHHWRWEHALHHTSAGNLDERGTGDIWTMTVHEYLESPWRRRFAYRLARQPFVLFVFAPFFVFAILQRFPSAKAGPRQRRSVWQMNFALLGMGIVMSAIFGLGPYLLIQSIVLIVSGAAGVWLFYVQHQFEGVYWERQPDWDYTEAALRGSSFYKLPKVLQWFSGNIGFHHVHHLFPRVPNYRLQECHERNPIFQQVKPLTLARSLKSAAFRLWDEREKKLVGYAHLRKIRRPRG